MRSTPLLACCLGVVFACSHLLGAESWPQFRGPTGQGHATTDNLPSEWSETENVTWKIGLPGRGFSSPVIAGDEIWLTTAVESEVSEEEKKKRLAESSSGQPLVVSGRTSLRALCVRRSTGKLLHDIELMVEEKPDPIHILNSFASPTPVLDSGRLYCHFGTNGTACLDTRSGKVLWTNRELRLNHENGPGSSPVLHQNRLIFHCDGSDVQYIVALDTDTGKIAWKTDRSGKMHSHPQMKKAYGTPLVVLDKNTSRSLLMSPASDWLYCYDPMTGRELWKVRYGVLGFSIVPRPVANDNTLYMCTSFMKSELLAVRFDGRGESPEPHIAWRYKKQVPRKPSPLLVGDELYIVSDHGVATCLDAKTGKVHWTRRLGGNHSASPLHAGGKIYFFSHEGETSVIEAATTFKKVATNQLDGRHMASAAAVDHALYLRTDKALYRIERE